MIDKKLEQISNIILREIAAQRTFTEAADKAAQQILDVCQPQWISVDDDLPKDGEEVLINEEFVPDDELSVLRNEYVSCHKLLDEHGIEDTHESGEKYSLFGRLCVFFENQNVVLHYPRTPHE